MAGSTIKIGRMTAAVDLYWQTIGAKDNARAYVRRLGDDDGQGSVEFFCVRPLRDNRQLIQVGSARADRGYREGMIAAAAVLVAALPSEKWVGCWQCREGWWVVIARDDVIDPYGDRLYHDEVEARAALEDAHQSGDKVYAPDTWRFPNADTSSLAVLMQGGRKSVTLKKVNGAYRRPALLGLLLLGVITAYTFHDEFLPPSAVEEKPVPMPVRKKSPAPLVQQAPEEKPAPPPVRLWEQLPKPSSLLGACHARLSTLPIGVQGWRMNMIICSSNGLDISWSRVETEAGVAPAGWTVAPDLKTANEHLPFEDVRPRGTEELWSPRQVTEFFLQWPLHVSLTAPPPKPMAEQGGKKPVEQPAAPPPPLSWSQRNLNFSIQVGPWSVSRDLDQVPGLVVNQVTHSYGQGQPVSDWTVIGTIYEARNEK